MTAASPALPSPDLQALIEHLGHPITVLDLEGRIIAVNEANARMLGRTRAELTGQFIGALLPQNASPSAEEQLRVVLREGSLDRDFDNVLPDGRMIRVHVASELVRSATGEPRYILASVENITDRLARDEERARLATAVEQTADSIMLMDRDRRLEFVNAAFTATYGYTRAEAVGQPASIIASGRHPAAFWHELQATVDGGRTWTGSIVNRTKDGRFVEVEASVSAIRDEAGRVTSYIQSDRDVSRQRLLESAITRQAREREAIERALEGIDPRSSPEAIAQAACDQIAQLAGLESVSVLALAPGRSRVLASAGPISVALRPGREIPRRRERDLLERTERGPWTETWKVRNTDGSYGEAISATGLQSTAFAPLRGSHGILGVLAVGSHDPDGGEALVERMAAIATFGSIVGALIAPALEDELRTADRRSVINDIVRRAAFTPHFQPIVDLRTRSVIGFEALTRFVSGERPDGVFATAADLGLGVDLELATLRIALKAAAAMPREAFLSLNVSPEAIASSGLRSLLATVHRRLVLEITEHLSIDDYSRLRTELAGLPAGVQIAVDDAGAGYSSLRHVLELNPDFVKLDLGLVRGIDGDEARQALVAGMSFFAVKRGARLIAEGIETRAELDELTALAVPLGQGFLLGRPSPADAPDAWPTIVDLPGGWPTGD